MNDEPSIPLPSGTPRSQDGYGGQADGSSLGELIAREGPLGWPIVRWISLQLTEELEPIHAKNAAHGDLSTESIRFSGPWTDLRIVFPHTKGTGSPAEDLKALHAILLFSLKPEEHDQEEARAMFSALAGGQIAASAITDLLATRLIGSLPSAPSDTAAGPPPPGTASTAPPPIRSLKPESAGQRSPFPKIAAAAAAAVLLLGGGGYFIHSKLNSRSPDDRSTARQQDQASKEAAAAKQAEQERLDREKKTAADTAKNQNAPTTVVTDVHQDWGVLVINAGSNAGITPQSILRVRRDGQIIAKAKPTSIGVNRTSADIDLKSLAPGMHVQVGDQVIIEQPGAGQQAAEEAAAREQAEKLRQEELLKAEQAKKEAAEMAARKERERLEKERQEKERLEKERLEQERKKAMAQDPAVVNAAVVELEKVLSGSTASLDEKSRAFDQLLALATLGKDPLTATDSGNRNAIDAVGAAYWRAQDFRSAKKWFERGAALNSPRSMLGLGNIYERGIDADGRNMEKAVQWWKKSADAGEPLAMSRLGEYYNSDPEARNIRLAMTWWQKAADLGVPEAMTNLGIHYSAGTAGDRDNAKAIALWEKAAALGQPRAMAELGYKYFNGEVPGKGEEDAFMLFQKAVEAKDPRAMTGLGVCYAFGKGTAADRPKAIKLLREAVALGEPTAAQYLKMLEKSDR